MITVLLLTYNRLQYAQETLKSFLFNVKCDGKINVHIADDGSPEGYIQRLVDLASTFNFVGDITSSNSMRSGYGANYNLALQTVHLQGDVIIPLEDDWRLERPFCVAPLLEALKDERIGCIRLGYLGYTQPLFGSFAYIAENHYFLFNPDSPEPHVFAGHPRIETRQWEREVGPWPENLDPNQTEFAVAHRPDARKKIAWPLDLVAPRGNLFAHIGTVRAR